MQGRLGVKFLKAGGDGAAVHDDSCGREAKGGDSVRRIRGRVGGDSGGWLVPRKNSKGTRRTGG